MKMIEPGPVVNTYRLSPMQQGMLFQHLSAPNSGVDIEQVVCTLHENLNIPAFRSAWERVVQRHDVFRTSFRWEKLAEPVQDVRQEASLPFVEHNWSNLSATDQEARLARFLTEDRQAGFDLSQAPNLRVMVARLATDQYQCIWTFHHILLDGRSYTQVLTEVFSLYDATCNGTNKELPEPLAFWKHIDWLQQQDWSATEQFWRGKLKGFTVPTNLRTLRPTASSEDQTQAGGEEEIRLSPESTAALSQFASAGGVTLGTLVQGAWAILLSRYSGEEEVVFGVTRAGRKSSVPLAESTVGIFINTVPLRVSVQPDRTVAAWLKDLRSQEFELRKYEHTPLFKVQQWSDVQGRKQIFDTLLMFDHADLNTALAQLGQFGKPREFQLKERVGFPLVLQAYGEARLLLKLLYAPSAFDHATVSRMLGHLQTLLEGMVAGAEKSIGALPLTTETERQQIVFSWNESTKNYPSDTCLHQLFEAQAARTPDAVALTCDGQSLTYRQLNTQANRLARAIRPMGVGPDVLVGICLERSNDLVIGLLAILKAGGAYLPIDMAYPADRLAFMLSDAQAPVLLTHSKLAKDLPPTESKVVFVDELLREDTGGGENLPNETGPDHLAYVIYTSGTTGKPKGSMITHRNVTRLFTATDHWYHFNEKDVWSLFHSYAFDFSVWEIWGALLYGGRVVVVPFMVSRSTEAFYDLLAREGVTVLNQTPSAFRHLIQAEEKVGQKNLALRYVIFGGEALEMQSLRPWFDRHGDEQPVLVNMYGITETTVHVTYRPLSRSDVKSDSVIGVPIPDLQVYILDPQLQLLPIGVPGEMYVGGAGLARGYLKRPDLTAQRFIPDHVTDRKGSLLYKTGDLARFLPGRDIEYLGRIDSQVKIRGFRIELGEIESVLCQHSAVRTAVVVAREDTPGDKRLVAYLVTSGAKPSVTELRDHLKKKMPEYMVPAAFVFLETIPLTNNGKVDRKALPEPDMERPDMGGAFVAPTTETEKVICSIWSEVLGIAQISTQDDFFALGGHSLIVLRAVSLINDQLKLDLSPAIMFDHRTVASLAEHLGEAKGAPGPSPASRPAPPAPASAPERQVSLAPIAEIAARARPGAARQFQGRSPEMKESWFCRHILAPLYGINWQRSRSFLQRLILKGEDGEYFSVTLRRLYRDHHNIQIGDYSCGCFDVHRMRPTTTIGRYTSIHPTAQIQNAEHPKNTISTNALFYHSAFGFAKGYELARVRMQVGNDVFIAHGATILYPTQKIGDGAIIAVGSVVVDDVPPYAIVGGYPARVLRYRFSKETIEDVLKSRWWEASLGELAPVKDSFAKPLEGKEIK